MNESEHASWNVMRVSNVNDKTSFSGFHSHWHLEHAHHQLPPYYDSQCELLLLKNHLITYRGMVWRKKKKHKIGKNRKFLQNARRNNLTKSLNPVTRLKVTPFREFFPYNLQPIQSAFGVRRHCKPGERRKKNRSIFHNFRTVIFTEYWTMHKGRKCLSSSLFVWCIYLARVSENKNRLELHNNSSVRFW